MLPIARLPTPRGADDSHARPVPRAGPRPRRRRAAAGQWLAVPGGRGTFIALSSGTGLVGAFLTAYDRSRPVPADVAHQLLLFQVLRAVFLTSLVVIRGDDGERAWWQSHVAPKLERVLVGRPSRAR